MSSSAIESTETTTAAESIKVTGGNGRWGVTIPIAAAVGFTGFIGAAFGFQRSGINEIDDRVRASVEGHADRIDGLESGFRSVDNDVDTLKGDVRIMREDMRRLLLLQEQIQRDLGRLEGQVER